MREVWQRYWSRMDWVREISYLALLGMEASILYPWQATIHDWFGYRGMPFWALCLLLWVLYWVAGLLNCTELAADRKQAITAGLVIVSALLNIRLFAYPDYNLGQIEWVGEMADHLFTTERIAQELILILLTFIAWWRGITAARQEYDTPTVWFHFRVGVIGLFAYLLLAIVSKPIDVTWVLMAFFFFGLVSIALARIQELGGIRASTLGSRRWLAVLGGATLGSLALGLLTAMIFSRRVLQAVLGWFKPLWDRLGQLLWWAAMAIFYILVPLFEWAMSWLQRELSSSGEEGETLFGSPVTSPLVWGDPAATSEWFPICQSVFVGLVILIGLLLVARLIRKLTQRDNEDGDLERESLLSNVNLMDELRKGLQDRLAQVRDLFNQFGDRHQRSIASIRKIYASMVDLAQEAGYPRDPAETPYEYRDTLYAAFPGAEASVDAVTEAYIRTHYGEVPDTREEMKEIVAHWQTIQAHVAPREDQNPS